MYNLKIKILSNFKYVFFLSVMLGILNAYFLPISYSDAIEHGQVLAGKVKYSSEDPLGLYFYKSYSFCNHLSALWIYVGFTKSNLALVLQLFKGISFYLGISLCTYSFTNKVLFSVISPIVVYSFGLYRFTDSYPITTFVHANTNGFIGLSCLIISIGLISNKKYKLGGFIIGLLPYIHLSFGVFAWLLSAAWVCIERSNIKKKFIYFFFSGAVVFISTFILHQYLYKNIILIDVGLSEYYFYFYTLLIDYHRQPLHLTSAHSFIILVSLISSIFYMLLKYKPPNYYQGVIIISILYLVILLGFTYSLLANTLGLSFFPIFLLKLMPGRLANIVILLAVCLQFALINSLTNLSSKIYTLFLILSAFIPSIFKFLDLGNNGFNESQFILTWYFSLTIAILFNTKTIIDKSFSFVFFNHIKVSFKIFNTIIIFVLICIFLFIGKLEATTWSPEIILERNQFILFGVLTTFFLLLSNHSTLRIYLKYIPKLSFLIKSIFFLSIIFLVIFSFGSIKHVPAQLEPEDYEIVKNFPHGKIIPTMKFQNIQVKYDRAVLYFHDAKTILPYVPESGLALEKILEDVYGWYQLYDPSSIGLSQKYIWENFSKERWSFISNLYDASIVEAPCNFKLQIPIEYIRGDICYFLLPKSIKDSENNIAFAPPQKEFDFRYFYFPYNSMFSKGFYTLNGHTPSSWNWLKNEGQIGVYVKNSGDYYLSSNIFLIDDTTISLSLHGFNQFESTIHKLTKEECHGVSIYNFGFMHLSAGFNIIDFKVLNKNHKYKKGLNSPIAFNKFQIEKIDEKKALNSNDSFSLCSSVLPIGANNISITNLIGNWDYLGRQTTIIYFDKKIIITNENGDTAEGSIYQNKILEVKDWNTFAYIIENGKTLAWHNGSVWKR